MGKKRKTISDGKLVCLVEFNWVHVSYCCYRNHKYVYILWQIYNYLHFVWQKYLQRNTNWCNGNSCILYRALPLNYGHPVYFPVVVNTEISLHWNSMHIIKETLSLSIWHHHMMIYQFHNSAEIWQFAQR